MEIKHKQLPMVLETYDVEEVYLPWGPKGKEIKMIRITIHGKNIAVRALEPVVTVGGEPVLYPEIHSDEQRIIGFLKKVPKEGSSIAFGYDKVHTMKMDEPFRSEKIKRIRDAQQ